MSEEQKNSPEKELEALRIIHVRLCADLDARNNAFIKLREEYACLRSAMKSDGIFHDRIVRILDMLEAQKTTGKGIDVSDAIVLIREAAGYDSILEHRRCTY